MACRVLVVATEVGGIPEIVRHGETGLLVPPRDAEALAKAIHQVLRGGPEVSAMVDQAERVVRAEFTWKLNARRTVSIYKECLSPRGLLGVKKGRSDGTAEQRN
jgi:glycosyltransferase involved in cell wall biosynthesis